MDCPNNINHDRYCLCICRTVSTTVDPFRDISLDLAPSSIVNRTSTPIEVNGNYNLYIMIILLNIFVSVY